MLPWQATANRKFRILITTEKGSQVSWFGDFDNGNVNATGTFMKSTSLNQTPANIATAINKMTMCTYLDNGTATYGNASSNAAVKSLYTNGTTNNGSGYSYGGGANSLFNASGNPWIAVSHVGAGETVNAITFTHTDTSDTTDPFSRIKFYGAKVCEVLGLAEGVWYHGAGFNLSVNNNVMSSIRGTIIADELNVQGKGYFGPNARFKGTQVFDVTGSEENFAGMNFINNTTVLGRLGYDPYISGSLVEVDLVRSYGDVIAVYSSDERLKDDIQYILNPIEKVKQLNGVEFKWNSSQSAYSVGTKDIGIIAQDLQKVYPELVSTGSHGYLGINSYGKLVGLLIEAVKEQNIELDDLKQRLNNLENN